MEWECCIKHPEDGAREGAEFIKKNIIGLQKKHLMHTSACRRAALAISDETQALRFFAGASSIFVGAHLADGRQSGNTRLTGSCFSGSGLQAIWIGSASEQGDPAEPEAAGPRRLADDNRGHHVEHRYRKSGGAARRQRTFGAPAGTGGRPLALNSRLQFNFIYGISKNIYETRKSMGGLPEAAVADYRQHGYYARDHG